MAKLFPPGYQFTDNKGAPVDRGGAVFYENGTTTLKNVYTDAAETVAAVNSATTVPKGQPLNSDGRFNQGDLYGTGLYTVTLFDSAGGTIWSRDNFNEAGVSDLDGDSSISSTNSAGTVFDDQFFVNIAGTDGITFGWQNVSDTGFITLDAAAVTADTTENTHRFASVSTRQITIPAGTTPVVSTVYLAEPNISNGGTITNAATLYLADAPTEGVANWALMVASGQSNFVDQVNTGLIDIDVAAFTADAATDVHRALVSSTNAIVIPAGTTALVSSLSVDEPNITATGTVTDATSLYVKAAPTEGASNWAAWFDSGNVRIDDSLYFGTTEWPHTTGTFSPMLWDSSFSDGESQTASVAEGRYTRVGNICNFTIRLAMSSLGTLTGGGQAFIGNFPFTASNSPTNSSFGWVSTIQGSLLAMAAAGDNLVGFVQKNTAYMALYTWDGTAGVSVTTVTEVSADAILIINGTYEI